MTMSVLERILDFLFPPRSTELRVRAATLESLGALVEPLVMHDDVVSLLSYKEPLVKALIVEAKFKDNHRAHQLLGSVLGDYLREWILEQDAFKPGTYALIPLPLSDARKRERGYNQIERILAHSNISDIVSTHTDLLMRIRDTIPQTTLDAVARLKNMDGAFSVRRPLDPACTYILIDDVTTTGATLREAARTLHQADARDILLLALAH